MLLKSLLPQQDEQLSNTFMTRLKQSFDNENIGDVTFEVPKQYTDNGMTQVFAHDEFIETVKYQCIGAIFAIHSSVLGERYSTASSENRVIKLAEIDNETFIFLHNLNPQRTISSTYCIVHRCIKLKN